MDIITIIILISSGILVGIVNTYAAGGVIISTSVLVAFGMPITVALGTNRICIFLQNLVSTIEFRRQKLINLKAAFRLFVPMGIGSIFGAMFANICPEALLTLLFTLGGLFSLVMVFGKKSVMERANDGLNRRPTIRHNIILLLIGLYAGSIYVGVGYMMLAIFMFGLGYDIIRANALKAFSALILSTVAIIPFIIHDNINYTFGFVHAIGNMIGAYMASRHATALGVKYIRWIMVIMIVVSLTNM
ncbi:MAG: sulfite exporter TauE/SafE family protein, partial [Rikenellaceae bacterium]